MEPERDGQGQSTGKRKALEAVGCLLYVVAFLVMGGVLMVKLGKL